MRRARRPARRDLAEGRHRATGSQGCREAKREPARRGSGAPDEVIAPECRSEGRLAAKLENAAPRPTCRIRNRALQGREGAPPRRDPGPDLEAPRDRGTMAFSYIVACAPALGRRGLDAYGEFRRCLSEAWPLIPDGS